MVQLVILRHGESIANQQNTYTGWSDVALTQAGIQQAKQAGQLIAQAQLQFEQVHTSLLKRAILTANLVLDQSNQLWIPMTKSWRLNERHYGALRGMNKDTSRELYGKQQVARWRRSYTSLPPLLPQPDDDRAYRGFPESIRPRGESLKMAVNRLIPYWQNQIAPGLVRGHNQLVVAHGSTLRALIKYLEQISDEAIDGVEIANGQPIVYELSHHLTIQRKYELN